MWNDMDIPLAYLITFRTYGTWLHGDTRGSVDRSNNIYGSPRVEHNPARKEFEKSFMDRSPVILNSPMRRCVELAIDETCELRSWCKFAANVRTNHAHSVISSNLLNANTILSALKANATRVMRENGCWISDNTPWVKGGSTRYLCNSESVQNAVNYVLFGQGDELPDFL